MSRSHFNFNLSALSAETQALFHRFTWCENQDDDVLGSTLDVPWYIWYNIRSLPPSIPTTEVPVCVFGLPVTSLYFKVP